MYYHIQEQAKALETREGVKLSGLVNVIIEKVFSVEDKRKYEIDQVVVPCKLLQVRISQPYLPYSAQGPVKGVRRIILLQFVIVQVDGYYLKVLELGIQDNLIKAHRELISTPRTPLGLANRYGDIPYAFPTAVPLTSLGALSDSLVYRYKPNNLLVIHVKKILVNDSKEGRDKYLVDQRVTVTKVVVEVFKVVKALEQDVFKDKSYFIIVEQDREAVQVDNLPEGEGNYRFNPHGVRDDKAKDIVKKDGSSEEGESRLSSNTNNQDEAEIEEHEQGVTA